MSSLAPKTSSSLSLDGRGSGRGWSLILALLIFVSACGGSGGPVSVGPDQDLGPTTPLEDLIYTDAYAGYLVVYFDAGVLAQLESGAVADVVLGDASPESKDLLGTASIARAVDAPAEKVKAQRLKLEKLSGRTLTDWNLVYHVDAANPGYAVQILRNLQGLASVDKVYPAFKPFPSTLITTPDLTGHQGYLEAEGTHGGVNAYAAWAAGVTGDNLYVVDNEHGMNFDHEEFNLVKANLSAGGNYLYQPECAPGFPDAIPNCDSWIAHGTAVTGILIAGDNGHGVTGFAPDAYYVHATMSGGVSNDLYGYTNGGDDDVEPGSIWVLEVQLPGKYNISGSCSGSVADQYGCVPVELWPDVFSAIEQATAYGVTVIEGGGNGQMDMDNTDLYTGGGWDFAHDLSWEDAGAVMIGASEGANEVKASFSNYGSRYDAFSWGQGVVTTAYPYGDYSWTGSTPPIPPNTTTDAYFMDNFGGTSSAAAIVAGAAALVQSYAREELGHRRYIMPLELRDILYDSGVAQAGGVGNIGKQPRIDVAMGLVDTFLTTVDASYPQLAADEQLTEGEMIALRAMGVGIICKEFDPAGSDPSCPDSELFPEGTKIAEHYDFDGDGRADLVNFANGNWKVDLSSEGAAADGFGAWDVDVSFTPLPGQWGVWPYVEDMNSDGRADFVAYDKDEGTFYVHLTDTDLTRNNVWHGWDWVIDYSAEWHDEMALDPANADYSRPALGDYNDDTFADIGIACSDGYVRVDYSDGTQGSLGTFDWTAQLLTDTMLTQAPGWAYLIAPGYYGYEGVLYFGVKVPDGHPDEGKMYIIPQDGVDFYPEWDWMNAAPNVFGGSSSVPLPSRVTTLPDVGIKDDTGLWRVTSNSEFSDLTAVYPADIYGNESCHPVSGDFDGDGIYDRTVMCPDEWRIAYSGTDFDGLKDLDGARHVALGYSAHELPGRTYSGGISYSYAQILMNFYQAQNPGDPVPIMVDMVSISSQ